MKYLLSILLSALFFSCHPPAPPAVVAPPQEAAEVPDSNMLASPGEMIDDKVFDDGSIPTDWATAGFSDPNQLKIFIKFLRFWVDKGNTDSIAAHIQYPLQGTQIKTSADFIKNYKLYFNNKVINALNKQKLSQIFRNSQGAMIGNGELWIRNISRDFNEEFKITAINK